MYRIRIINWSATDYAYLINNQLGYVSDDQLYYEFDTKEEMDKMEKYLKETNG